MNKRVLMVRHGEVKGLCAVLTWTGYVQVLDFQAALIRALSGWVKATRAGWDAWQDNHQELCLDQIPDLLTDPDLIHQLKEQGIENLVVTLVDRTYDEAHNWSLTDDLLGDVEIL